MNVARDDRVPIALIVAVWLLSTAVWLRPGITRPDGVGYFAWLPSAIEDRDLVLYDQWARFGMLPGGAALSESPTANGHLGDHWSVGSAVTWAPAYLLFARTPLAANAACVAASAFFGLVTLLAGYAAARRLFRVDAALIATIAMWFGSPLLWYSEREALMAHAAGAAACALIVLCSMRSEWTAAALLSGFAFAIRPQNAAFLAVPLILGKKSALKPSSFVAFVVGALPQLVVSQFLYGAPLPLFDLDPRNPQRPWHAFERFRGWEVLASWFHGLVPWTPLLLAGIIGLAFLLRADRRLGIAAMAMFATQWLINATGDRVFWGGVSFGQRRFDNCAILFLLGSAALFARLPRWASIAIAAATSAWTMALFFASQAVDLNRYVAPAQLWDAFLRVPKRIGFLIDVPPSFRSSVALIAIGVFVLYAILAAAVSVRPVVAGTIVCLVAAAWLGYCGTHDAAVLARWQPVIERSRAYGGSERDHRALLEVEADWLRRR